MDVVKKSRPGGRSRNKRKSNPFSISQTPWSLPINNDNFIEPVLLTDCYHLKNALGLLYFLPWQQAQTAS